MSVNYAIPQPTPGTSRATSPTETEILIDVSDTIADVGGRLDAVEASATTEAFRSASEMSAALGGTVLTSVAQVPVWLLDDSTDEAVSVVVGAGAMAGWLTFDVVALTVNATADSGDFVLVGARDGFAAGESIANATYGSNVVTTAAAQYISQEVTLFSGVAVPAAGVQRLTVFRDANDAADTKAGDVGIVGIFLRRAS